jgi:hypothetical protein
LADARLVASQDDVQRRPFIFNQDQRSQTMNAVVKTIGKTDFHVADLSLADWGRKEIRIAETEMPGLMAIREEYAPTQPLRSVRRFAGPRATSSRLKTMQPPRSPSMARPYSHTRVSR